MRAGLPARTHRDRHLEGEIHRVWQENFQLYGVRKMWRQLNREAIAVARCTVARLMARMGLRGVVRGRQFRTTVADAALARPEDRVQRNFAAERPDALWVSDLTYGTPSQRSPPVWGTSCLSMSGMHVQ